MNARQAHLFGVLRRADESWLELWELARRAGYTSRATVANVRELRHAGIVVARRTEGERLSAVEVSLARGGVS
jgi:hypothetical protein